MYITRSKRNELEIKTGCIKDLANYSIFHSVDI
jgi:hypothetical protein